MKKFHVLLALFILLFVQGRAQVSLSLFSSGYVAPVDIKNCGDDRLFIVEQNGRIQIVDTNGVKNSTPFLNIISRVKYQGEQGLLGLAFAPDFLTSGYFYVYYTAQTHGDERISRFHVNPLTPNVADANSEEILLQIWDPYSNHNGGHLAFGPDGYLYMGTGDGGSAGDPENRAQNVDSLLGKILRIKVDPSIPTYSIPADNPFACNPTPGREEIWSYGVRNPWRWSFDRITGDLWIADVGQNIMEEIDFQPAWAPGGRNYGWRCWEATLVYATDPTCLPFASYTAPVYTYQHTSGNCSVTGGYVYRGALHNDMWGKYFFTDYCVSSMRTLYRDSTGAFIYANLGTMGATNVSGFGEDRWGELYCAANGTGNIYKFSSADCIPAVYINAGSDTVIDCGNPSVDLSVSAGKHFSYAWSYNGTSVGTDTCVYTATAPGIYSVTVTSNTGCTAAASTEVVNVAPVAVSIGGLDTLYCVYNPAVSMLPSPLGGTFSGPGVVCSQFDPATAGIGTHEIVYSYRDPRGCAYTATQQVRVDACTGMNDPAWLHTVSLYPNPGKGNFNLTMMSDREKILSVRIVDMLGKEVMFREVKITSGTTTVPIAAELEEGIYSVQLNDGQSTVTRSLIVQK